MSESTRGPACTTASICMMAASEKSTIGVHSAKLIFWIMQPFANFGRFHASELSSLVFTWRATARLLVLHASTRHQHTSAQLLTRLQPFLPSLQSPATLAAPSISYKCCNLVICAQRSRFCVHGARAPASSSPHTCNTVQLLKQASLGSSLQHKRLL